MKLYSLWFFGFLLGHANLLGLPQHQHLGFFSTFGQDCPVLFQGTWELFIRLFKSSLKKNRAILSETSKSKNLVCRCGGRVKRFLLVVMQTFIIQQWIRKLTKIRLCSPHLCFPFDCNFSLFKTERYVKISKIIKPVMAKIDCICKWWSGWFQEIGVWSWRLRCPFMTHLVMIFQTKNFTEFWYRIFVMYFSGIGKSRIQKGGFGKKKKQKKITWLVIAWAGCRMNVQFFCQTVQKRLSFHCSGLICLQSFSFVFGLQLRAAQGVKKTKPSENVPHHRSGHGPPNVLRAKPKPVRGREAADRRDDRSSDESRSHLVPEQTLQGEKEEGAASRCVEACRRCLRIVCVAGRSAARGLSGKSGRFGNRRRQRWSIVGKTRYLPTVDLWAGNGADHFHWCIHCLPGRACIAIDAIGGHLIQRWPLLSACTFVIAWGCPMP